MNNRNGALHFEASIGNDRLKRDIAEIRNEIQSLTDSTVRETARMDAGFNRLAAGIGAAFTIDKGRQFVSDLINIRGQYQQLHVAFTTMLQSKSAADAMMAQSIRIAATTPFSLSDVSQGTKQLLAYGTGANEVGDVLVRLGDIAAGLSIPLNDLIYLYGTLQTQGRAYAVDIRQFAGRGVPIYEELAKVLGVSKDRVNELVEAGKVGFPEVEKALNNLTNKGGDFYNLMKEQSKTLSGQLSNLGDSWEQMYNKIGAANEGILSDGIKGAAYLVENYETVGKVLAGLIATYGTYRAALITVAAAQGILTTTNSTIAASITSESGALARSIALKIENAQTTANLAAAIATETAARAAAAAANETSIRAEFGLMAAKEAEAIETAKVTAANLAEAEAKVAAASAAVAKARFDISASAQSVAAKQLEVAENELLAASEAHVAATKAASSISADVNTKKYLLDAAAKQADTAANVANAASTVATTAANNAAAVASQRVTLATILQTKAQAALNLVANTNPYVLLATAITGVATVMWLMYDGTTALERATKALNEQNEELREHYDSVKNEATELIGIIQSETASQLQKMQAYERLKQILPELTKAMSLHDIQTQDLAKSTLALNHSLDDLQVSEKAKQFDEARKKLEEMNEAYQEALRIGNYSGDALIVVEQYEAQKKVVEDIRKEYELLLQQQKEAAEQERINNMPVADRLKYYKDLKNELELQKQAMDAINSVSNGLGNVWAQFPSLWDDINNRIKKVNSSIAELMGGPKNKSYYETLQKDAKERFESALPGTDAFKQAKKDYDAATESLKAWDLTQKKVKVKKEDIVLPAGSMGEIERQIRKAEDALSKIPATQIERVKAMHDTLLRLTEQHEEAKKVVEFRTWKETLDYKREQYEEFERYLEGIKGDVFTGDDVVASEEAKKYYADLLEGGQNYYQFLKNSLVPLEEKRASGTITREETAQYLTLYNAIRMLEGVSTPMEQFQERLDKIKDEAASTSQYISQLKQEMESLNNVPVGERDDLWLAQFKTLKEDLKHANDQAVRELRNFLEQVKGSEQKRLQIVEKYKSLREQALKEGADTSLIDKSEKNELAEWALEANKALEMLQNTVYDMNSRRDLQKLVEDTRKAYEMALANPDSSKFDLDALLQNYNRAKRDLKDFDLKNWKDWLSTIQQAGAELSDIPGILGDIGQLVNALTDGLQDVVKLLEKANSKDGLSTGDSITGIIGGVTSLISIVAGSISQRKKAAEDYYTSVIAQQNDYNLALIEQLRLQDEISANLFTTNYVDRMNDGFASMKAAAEEYIKVLQQLAEGEVITGQRNKIDWGAVGSGALSGVAAGASIGSVIPGIGNVVGAVVGGLIGGIVGLFGGKKKADVFGNLLEEYPELINASGELNKALAESLISAGLLSDQTAQVLQYALDLQNAIDEARQQIEAVITDLTGDLGNSLRDVLVDAFENGEDAARSFGDTVESVIENALSNIIFSQVFDKAFEALSQRMKASFDIGGDNNWLDDFADFFAQSEELTEAFNKALQEAKDQGKEFGFDLFDPSGDDRANGLSGISRTITEDTASELLGQTNAMRIAIAMGNDLLRDQIFLLTAISDNSTRFLPFLMSIDARLERMERGDGDILRSTGITL